MDFAIPSHLVDTLAAVDRLLAERIIPAEAAVLEQGFVKAAPLLTELRTAVQAAGLWGPQIPKDAGGMGLGLVDHALISERIGRSPLGHYAFGCQAPDAGNLEVLHKWGTAEQKARWMAPLAKGELRSCFSMTEPENAGSNPTLLSCTATLDGDHWVVDGHKWFTTGAANPDCKLLIVMCRSGTDEAGKHAQHSMLLVPLDTPGVTVVRNIPIMQHHSPEGHCEIVFRDVHLPLDHLLGKPGEGFAMAQARLGPGRIHHCMRTIGQCELALSMMCERTLEREAFGKHLSDFANVQEWIAESRLEIDQARLLVLRAAWQLDQGPSAQSRVDVSAIKVVAARLQTRVVNRAIQVFGAMGLSNDTPLAYFWTWGRAMQLLDGPDEVHLRSVARHELSQARQQLGASAAYFTLPEQLLAEPRIR